MKKLIILSVLLVSFGVLAQVASNQFVSAPSVPSAQMFSWQVFIQQVLANGGLVLLGYLCSQIPVVGPYIKKIIDVLMGNPEHK